MSKSGRIKGRSSVTYNRKVTRMKARHAKALIARENNIAKAKKEGKELNLKPVWDLKEAIAKLKGVTSK